jgi:hypothetical protein
VEVDENAIYTQQFTNLHTLTLKMEAACSSEMVATLSTATWCGNNPRTELTSIINHHESLKSVFTLYFYVVLHLRHEVPILKLVMMTDNIIQSLNHEYLLLYQI